VSSGSVDEFRLKVTKNSDWKSSEFRKCWRIQTERKLCTKAWIKSCVFPRWVFSLFFFSFNLGISYCVTGYAL
jgi:hypothetical protein